MALLSAPVRRRRSRVRVLLVCCCLLVALVAPSAAGHDYGDALAFTATMLAWGVVEFGDAMPPAERAHAADAVRWATDYLLKTISHPGVIFIQASTHTNTLHCAPSSSSSTATTM
uniref:cellulase n=1 Tax=Oryza barthii TaxID=65489 RepID=A0A0D3H997_9ORYZ